MIIYSGKGKDSHPAACRFGCLGLLGNVLGALLLFSHPHKSGRCRRHRQRRHDGAARLSITNAVLYLWRFVILIVLFAIIIIKMRAADSKTRRRAAKLLPPLFTLLVHFFAYIQWREASSPLGMRHYLRLHFDCPSSICETTTQFL